MARCGTLKSPGSAAVAAGGITIAAAAKRARVGVETVRFYEKEGLLDPPARNAAGYRQYTAEDVRRLSFVRRAKELGFTLREIKELIALTQSRQATAGEAKSLALAKLTELRERIRDLRRIERALSQLTHECSGTGPASGCPILNAMALEQIGSPEEPAATAQRSTTNQRKTQWKPVTSESKA